MYIPVIKHCNTTAFMYSSSQESCIAARKPFYFSTEMFS